jgi:hypothetical protein
MNGLPMRLTHKLHPKRLDKSMGALASLASAISVFVGVFAARIAPHGWHRAFVTLHLSKDPMIVRLAPIIAGIAIAVATAGAILRFFNWCTESADADPGSTS